MTDYSVMGFVLHESVQAPCSVTIKIRLKFQNE